MSAKAEKKKEVRPPEMDMLLASRRKPVVKRSVYRIVFTCLQKKYDKGIISEVTFEEVNKEVRKHFPDSKFNPFHLAHYKHKFLSEAP